MPAAHFFANSLEEIGLDPATGISFGYLSNGFDRNDMREGRRRVALSSLAASCAV